MTGGICGPPEPAAVPSPPLDGEMMCVDVVTAEVYAPWRWEAPFQARVFVTNRRVVVWRADADEHGRYTTPAYLALEAAHDQEVKRERGTFWGQLSLDTTSGPVYVTRTRGCGCHSPLGQLQAPVAW